MASYRPGLSLVATRPLLQQTNIYLSVSSFGLLLLFPKNLSSLRSFRFSGSPSFCSFGARESLIAYHNARDSAQCISPSGSAATARSRALLSFALFRLLIWRVLERRGAAEPLVYSSTRHSAIFSFGICFYLKKFALSVILLISYTKHRVNYG